MKIQIEEKGALRFARTPEFEEKEKEFFNGEYCDEMVFYFRQKPRFRSIATCTFNSTLYVRLVEDMNKYREIR